jgi:hypothetical protein
MAGRPALNAKNAALICLMPLPRLILRLCAVALLVLGAGPALAQDPGSSRWLAVLVAGDKAEPVFDNAVAALSHWLGSHGVPAQHIHRFSAAAHPDDRSSEPATAERILNRIAALRPRPGERCLVFITSHGERGEGIWLAYSGEYLRPAALAQALSGGCAGVPSVVIVSGCFSGSFTAIRAPNRIVLTAARPDRPSFGCQVDRTYSVFDQCLLSALPRSATWRVVYTMARDCVRHYERELQVVPSQPQAVFGSAVRALPVR